MSLKYQCNSFIQYESGLSPESALVLASKYEVALIIEAPMTKSIFTPSKIAELAISHSKIVAITPRISPLSELNSSGSLYTAQYNSDDINEQIQKAFLSKRKESDLKDIFTPKMVAKAYYEVFENL